MAYQKQGLNGKILNEVDPLGNVFRPIPGQPLSVAWSFGPDVKGQSKTPMFSCPVSAIPREVFDLLFLWNESRLMGLPPVAGGLLDQPPAVRAAFPHFWMMYRELQRLRGEGGAEQAAMMAAGLMIQGLFGGK